MSDTFLATITADEAQTITRAAVSAEILRQAIEIVETVRLEGENALLEYSRRFGDLDVDSKVVFDASDLEAARGALDSGTVHLLRRTARRIERFATAQAGALAPLQVEVEGGTAGHSIRPVESVGAYAPGGRHPLPSSVLMTVIPARVAGVRQIWVASPRPSAATLAAAHVAGADGLIGVGGAQAIAALAFGTVSPACDMIVGPGNVWVTAAKKHLYGEIGIDGLAGPSEIVVIADESADPARVASDLLAQAEHDPLALPILIGIGSALVDMVDSEIATQLADLPTSSVAIASLRRGFSVRVEGLDEAVALANRLAPEHLALHIEDARSLVGSLTSYGSLFIGSQSVEALADYGIGPNHVLPTGGGARHQSGLSVFTFLRTPTWLDVGKSNQMSIDAAALARLEGLEAHARAIEKRRTSP